MAQGETQTDSTPVFHIFENIGTRRSHIWRDTLL